MTATLFILKFIIWAAVAYGITQIVVDSMLFEKIRRRVMLRSPFIGSLIHCMLCTGVWVSFILSTFLWSPSETLFFYDVVNVESMAKLQYKVMYMDHGDFESAMTSLGFTVLNFFASCKFMFYDGMIGSTVVWFMYVVERRWLSGIKIKQQE